MEKAGAFEARVVLENGAYFAYQSPSKSTCIQLSECPNWQAAKAVVWRNLPAHWYINFFQSDNCVGNDGDVFSVARDRAIDGVHTFSSPRGIKSIYARPSNGKISWSVARKCVQPRAPDYGMINYQNGMRLRYDNPSERYCMRLDTCPHWAPTTWVSWWNLPTHQVGIFFETKDCTFRDGKYNFKTTRDRVDGWKEFETPKSIRSFKFGDYEDALLAQNLTEAAQTCNVAKARATFEDLEVNDTVANATSTIELSSAEGGLSSNWTNPLPVESEKPTSA